ncbi:hypothetical protein AURDEDRAFT_182440 [Auricularia subglabra TFB-10046 SS5]|nr:hypothetical protein AURDEDRAFT_182440 [Auricularia subglabra TFB-10046 SS5]
MASFPPATRALLNPKFEGYRLQPLEQSDAVFPYHLPAPATQSTVSGRAFLSFQEVANRIKHNHLSVAHNRPALYIDANGGVNLVTLDESLEPSFHRIFEIPQQIAADDEVLSPEYPCGLALDAEHWIVSDGWGRFYVVHTSHAAVDAPIIGQLVSVAELALTVTSGSSAALFPCRLHQAILGTDGAVSLVVSVKVVLPKDSSATEARTEASKLTRFDLIGGRIPSVSSEGDPQRVDVLWRLRGDSIPLSVSYDAQLDSIFVVSESQYCAIDSEPMDVVEPTPDEYAPIPRADENLETSNAPRPPPYSWTQTDDSVTVAIPLPSATLKTQIKVHLSPRTLSLSIQDPTGSLAELASVPLPHYTLEEFWDGISPSSSLWTWDSKADRTYGLLSLHIDKQHEGTKWAHLFARSASGGLPDVPETLDPSELWNIMEALEKYTADLGGPARGGIGLASQRDMPSLADGEMDDDVDSNVGTLAHVSVISRAGAQPSGRKVAPVTVLSLPLPGTGVGDRSLVLKHDIDGTLYERTAAGEWEHAATYSAIAFVLASKRDLRYVHHVSTHLLLAFESGGKDAGGNLFLYRGCGPKDQWAVQAVLRLGGGDAGALLGVGAMQTAGGQDVLVCLFEHQLAVLRNVL